MELKLSHNNNNNNNGMHCITNTTSAIYSIFSIYLELIYSLVIENVQSFVRCSFVSPTSQPIYNYTVVIYHGIVHTFWAHTVSAERKYIPHDATTQE